MWRNIETFPVEAGCSIPPFPRPGKIYNFLSPKTYISGRIRHTLSLIGNTLVACGGQDAPAMTTCISWQSGQSEWTDYYTLRLSCTPKYLTWIHLLRDHQLSFFQREKVRSCRCGC